MNNEKFWSRVKAQQIMAGLKQSDIANACGVSLGVYKNWIYRGAYPRLDQAVAIAKTLNTTVEYLVTGEGSYVSAEQLMVFEETVKTKFSELINGISPYPNMGVIEGGEDIPGK